MTVRVAVPRKGRPLEAVLERIANAGGPTAAVDSTISTLRYEKDVTKGNQTPARPVYDRLADYSDASDPHAPEFTLLRDAREGFPRRVVFDSMTVRLGDAEVQLVGREEPFRALRKHEFALGFDSADLVLEEVVDLRPAPLASLEAVNDRIDPMETDVRVVDGLDDTVYHTLLATPDAAGDAPLDRSLVGEYEGELCISPRYERLVEAVLGTDALDGIEFVYPTDLPDTPEEEEAAIARVGLGVYVTVTGGTARDHGLLVGEELFPSETVLLENAAEADGVTDAVTDRLLGVPAVAAGD